LRGQASRTFSLSENDRNSDDTLPLTNKEYYELIELLTFHIHLPLYGMSKAYHLLKEIPMNTKVKSLFVDRLKQIRNFVVADVQLTNGKELIFKSEEFKPQESKQELEEQIFPELQQTHIKRFVNVM